MTHNKIKVLIIDDSAVLRHLLAEILSQTDDIEVVGTAQDPLFAMSKITSLEPDVITLDVEMPRMDGLSFLEQLMRTHPVPVIMISALTQRGGETTLKALELGAVDYVTKPGIGIADGIARLGEEIVHKIRIAARAKVKRRPFRSPTGQHEQPPPAPLRPERPSAFDTRCMATTDRIIAIGASTGGTQAITEIITELPEDIPGIVIVQHMPPLFTRSFAERLNTLSRLDVREAKSGDRILRGAVLIAPGNKHMTIQRDGALYYVEVTDGPMVNFVRPSVDVLFRSVARYAGKNAIGVILTGMGEDGARGLLEMQRAGALTIAQDESSSTVFGMPKRAIEMHAVDRITPLHEIASLLAGSSRH
ncbi:MAG: chemotaxis response regulator protein-glutamate methylesterase [Nitrospirota bacterium]